MPLKDLSAFSICFHASMCFKFPHFLLYPNIFPTIGNMIPRLTFFFWYLCSMVSNYYTNSLPFGFRYNKLAELREVKLQIKLNSIEQDNVGDDMVVIIASLYLMSFFCVLCHFDVVLIVFPFFFFNYVFTVGRTPNLL